jgi:hypothetical protein
MALEQRFEDLVDQLSDLPDVTPPGASQGFGRSALRVRNKIFGMFVRGQLVLKLPRSRVDELVEAGEGRRFDANKGTPMKEWLVLSPGSTLPWKPLADEALAFVRG